jgi:hypothetical protein
MVGMSRLNVLLLHLLLSLGFLWTAGSAFHVSYGHGQLLPVLSSTGRDGSRVRHWSQRGDDSDEPSPIAVEVGTKEYLKGFISSPLQDKTVQERGSGLEQALKLGGLTTAVLLMLVFGFMASNGLM